MTFDRRWTQSDLTELRTRIQGGEDVEQVATAMDRSLEATKKMTARLRLRPPLQS